jgi:hypothetical protein
MFRAPGSRPWPGVLDWGGDWVADAARELADLGFVLRDGQRPSVRPGPRLLVAFRDHPALTHFDPDEATYWAASDGHGRAAVLDRHTPLPVDRPYAWGRITVTDRIPVSNQFLSFGGRLAVEAVDDALTIAAFVSPAPIGRWAGHSQGVDAITAEMGAFFGRLMVPVDFQPGAEERILGADPETLYATFLLETGRRLGPRSPLRTTDPAFAAYVDRERARLQRDAPAVWRAAVELQAWLELS